MKAKKWTILLVAGEDTSVRQFHVSGRGLRWLLAGGATAVIALLALLVLNGIGGAAWVRVAQLSHENAVLEEELTSIRGQVDGLEESLGHLVQKDEEVRLLAGLEPIDSEVLEVGIGGPGSESLTDHALWSVDSTASKEAFAASYDLRALERRARLLSESLDEAADSLRAHHDLLQSVPSILPTTGNVSSRFSKARRHPIHNEVLPHQGVDLSAREGTPILAAAQGRVIFASRRAGYGQVVIIDHGYGYETRYGHASKLLVRRGQSVERGDVIALVGNSGLATAPHLHYEVRVGGTAVNPMNYVLEAIP
jgi:hypothetical protein